MKSNISYQHFSITFHITWNAFNENLSPRLQNIIFPSSAAAQTKKKIGERAPWRWSGLIKFLIFIFFNMLILINFFIRFYVFPFARRENLLRFFPLIFYDLPLSHFPREIAARESERCSVGKSPRFGGGCGKCMKWKHDTRIKRK